MLERFQGEAGKRLLIDALRAQEVVEHDAGLAARLAEAGELRHVAMGADLIEQDANDNDLYFIVQGSATVYVNERHVATRGPGHCVGEMALIDVAAPRAATVRAMTEMVVVKVTEAQFQPIGDAHPQLWRSFAKMLAARLRQRSAFHRAPNPEPVLFLGCSSEALPLATAIKEGLAGDKIDVRIWNDGLFGPSSITLDTLLDAAKAADFAALIFGADDHVISRGAEQDAPRDNVVFELGLFMGQLDRERAFVISGPDKIKVPTDLLGLTHIRSKAVGTGDIAQAAADVCNELRGVIGRVGVR
jgi:CRP/FNR family transcriptional regulator, cyclic AMP receptor protein